MGVVTGGSNVQFAVDPESGRVIVIEMNPRVSRSSALASKATGYPIAKIAALLAVGYTLPELPNEITGTSSACFEPSIDYTVVKVPRWAFEKFPGTPDLLGTTMQSVGEVMAIGRTFREALQKALRSLELGFDGWESPASGRSLAELRAGPGQPQPGAPDRPARGLPPRARARTTAPPDRHRPLVPGQPAAVDGSRRPPARLHPGRAARPNCCARPSGKVSATAASPGCCNGPDSGADAGSDRATLDLRTALVLAARQAAGPEARLPPGGHLRRRVRQRNPLPLLDLGRRPLRKPAHRPAQGHRPGRRAQPHRPGHRIRHLLLPRRPGPAGRGHRGHPGQLQSRNREHRLRSFGPPLLRTPALRRGHAHRRRRKARRGDRHPRRPDAPEPGRASWPRPGVPILGTGVDAIDRAEDRDRCGELLDELGIAYPRAGSARDLDEALATAAEIGYPVMVRPSYVLGGRAMRVVYDDDGLRRYFEEARSVSGEHPVLIDQFLEDAVEFDVDAVCDGHEVLIGGIMQHIEEAGIHSGDSFAVLPPYKTTRRRNRASCATTRGASP